MIVLLPGCLDLYCKSFKISRNNIGTGRCMGLYKVTRELNTALNIEHNNNNNNNDIGVGQTVRRGALVCLMAT